MEQKISDRVVLTGCDHKTEWQLPWFLKNFKKQRNKTKIVVADFGMSPEINTFAVVHPCVEAVMNIQTQGKEKGWFLKLAILCYFTYLSLTLT